MDKTAIFSAELIPADCWLMKPSKVALELTLHIFTYYQLKA
jgi:hypothetical protein